MTEVRRSLAEVVRERIGDLPQAERRVGRALLATYPSAGLETVARLAERAEVSPPTVVRFATRLGFSGFPDLQRALREEIDEREAFPLTLVAARRAAAVPTEGTAGLLAQAGEVLAEAVRTTVLELPPDEVDAAVRLLVDPSRRITVAGGRFSRLLGQYLGLHLMQLRERVRLLPDTPVERAAALVDVGRKDVVVLFDFRRYEPRTEQLATLLRERGAQVVLVTDRWLSPVAHVADVVLPARVDSPSAYDSLAPTLAIIEVLIAAVVVAYGEDTEARLARFEQVSQAFALL